MSEFDGLKIGDDVYVSRLGSWVLTKVTKVGRVWFETRSGRYRLADGATAGGNRGRVMSVAAKQRGDKVREARHRLRKFGVALDYHVSDDKVLIVFEALRSQLESAGV